MQKKYTLLALLAIPVFCLLAYGVYRLTPIYDYFNPPEEVVFVPQGQVDTIVQATLRALTPSPTATFTPTFTPTIPGVTPLPTFTPTLTPTSLPEIVVLEGVRYMDQHGVWNYCGPANLAMALSYWGWDGNRYDTGGYLRGSLDRVDDKNVMPYEMQNYVEQETDLGLLWRFGGDLDLLKRLIAGGFPVIVEKSFSLEGIGWMGHYLLLTGYDEGQGIFIAQDAYIDPNTEVPYETLFQEWRAFNYTFIVVYDHALEAELFAILGPWLDDEWDDRHALEIAQAEVQYLTGLDLFYATFNIGTSHVYLYEYFDAALAYDIAWPINDAIPWEERAWRMIWYQTGPYMAYYYAGRYQDIVTLSNDMLVFMEKNDRHGAILEESFYWRGMAREMLGDLEGAIADLLESVRLNPNFAPGWAQLRRLGVEP